MVLDHLRLPRVRARDAPEEQSSARERESFSDKAILLKARALSVGPKPGRRLSPTRRLSHAGLDSGPLVASTPPPYRHHDGPGRSARSRPPPTHARVAHERRAPEAKEEVTARRPPWATSVIFLPEVAAYAAGCFAATAGSFMMRRRNAKKVLAGSGFVKKSARLSAVRTKGTRISRASTMSRTK